MRRGVSWLGYMLGGLPVGYAKGGDSHSGYKVLGLILWEVLVVGF